MDKLLVGSSVSVLNIFKGIFGVSVSNLESNTAEAFFFGSSIANLVHAGRTINTNLDILYQNDQNLSTAINNLGITDTLNAIVGVSVYNLDSWNRIFVGTTFPFDGIMTMGVSHKNDIFAGISYRNIVGVSYNELINVGTIAVTLTPTFSNPF